MLTVDLVGSSELLEVTTQEDLNDARDVVLDYQLQTRTLVVVGSGAPCVKNSGIGCSTRIFRVLHRSLLIISEPKNCIRHHISTEKKNSKTGREATFETTSEASE